MLYHHVFSASANVDFLWGKKIVDKTVKMMHNS
jgi:hypothetical protein